MRRLPAKQFLLNHPRLLTAVNAYINVPFISVMKSGQGFANITIRWLETVVRMILLLHMLLKRKRQKGFNRQKIDIDNYPEVSTCQLMVYDDEYMEVF